MLFTDLSDHLPVFVTMGNLQKLNIQNNNKNKFRLFNDKTINRLCQDLECEDWIDVYSKTDA